MNSRSRTSRTTSRWRWWIFRALALCIPVLVFVVIELGLQVAGTGYPSDFFVPSQEQPGCLQDNYKFSYRFFPRTLARTAQPVVVSRKKADRTKRIVVLGASAAMGDPEPAYGFSRMLEVLLEARFPQYRFELVSTAMTAINSNVVLPIAQDCAKLDADAWIIYLGNNEVHGPFGAGTVFNRKSDPLWMQRTSLWLQEFKTGQLLSSLLKSAPGEVPAEWAGMEMFLDQQIRHDDAALEVVYQHYRCNLRDIVRLAKRHGVPPILSTVVTNVADCSPLVSLHRKGLSDADLKRWQSAFAAGCEAQSERNAALALEEFAVAEKIDDEFAELAFRMAQCLLQQGRQQDALTKFNAARDLDALRFRADSKINDVIRSVAEQTDVALVDSETQLSAGSPGGIPGANLFHEHVHFHFSGNYWLAIALAPTVAETLGLLSETEQPQDDWLDEAQIAHRLGYSSYFERRTLVEMRFRLKRPPFTQQFDHVNRDRKLAARIAAMGRTFDQTLKEKTLADSLALVNQQPDDYFARRQFAVLLDSVGDLPGVVEQFRAIVRLVPHHAESHFRLGAVLSRMKEYEAAIGELELAIKLRSDFSLAMNSLGICYSHLGEFERSYDWFRNATETRRNYAEAFHNWGLVLENQKQMGAALEKYRQAIVADSSFASSHVKIGAAFTKQGRLKQALSHYEAVSRLRPKDENAQQNLGLLYLRLNANEAARKQFHKVLKLNPRNGVAQKSLVELDSQL